MVHNRSGFTGDMGKFVKSKKKTAQQYVLILVAFHCCVLPSNHVPFVGSVVGKLILLKAGCPLPFTLSLFTLCSAGKSEAVFMNVVCVYVWLYRSISVLSEDITRVVKNLKFLTLVDFQPLEIRVSNTWNCECVSKLWCDGWGMGNRVCDNIQCLLHASLKLITENKLKTGKGTWSANSECTFCCGKWISKYFVCDDEYAICLCCIYLSLWYLLSRQGTCVREHLETGSCVRGGKRYAGE